LVEEQTAVEFLEDEQTLVRLRLEQARLSWDLARYKVRGLEAMKEAAAIMPPLFLTASCWQTSLT
jgi:hypothetical protein